MEARLHTRKLHNALFTKHNASKGIMKKPTIFGQRKELKSFQHDLVEYVFGSSDEDATCTKNTTCVSWPTGSGKTIGAIAVIARKYLECDPSQFRALFVTTTSFIEKAMIDLCNWTTLRRDVDIVVMDTKDDFLSPTNWNKAKIIVCSLSTLEALEQHFWHYETYEVKIPGTTQKMPATKPSEWIRKGPDPEFYVQIAAKPLDVLVVDEGHKYWNHATYKNHAIHRLSRSSMVVLGMSATWVKNKPEEMPGVCKALNVMPEDLQNLKRWQISKGKDVLMRKTGIELWHKSCVHQVEEGHDDIKVDKKELLVEIWPYIGYDYSTGTVDEDFINELNTQLEDAKDRARFNHKGKAPTGFALKTNTVLMAAVNTGTVAPISKVIAKCAAPKLDKHAEVLFGEALKETTAFMQILYKIIRSRQMAGKGRVVVYCESQKSIRHMANVLHKLGQCGRIVPFDGLVPIRKRQKAIDNFLSAGHPRGVFLMTRTGEESITLCGPKGSTCSVLIQVGSDWSPETDRQVIGRCYRGNQEEDVEHIKLVPRHGMTAAKRSSHYDKSSRMVAAIKNRDYSGFRHADQDDEEYRKTNTLIKTMTMINSDGNYMDNPDLMDEIEYHEWENESRAEVGIAPKPPPNVTRYRSDTPQLPSEFVVPPVSFPVEGYNPERGCGRHYDTIVTFGTSMDKYHACVLSSAS